MGCSCKKNRGGVKVVNKPATPKSTVTKNTK